MCTLQAVATLHKTGRVHGNIQPARVRLHMTRHGKVDAAHSLGCEMVNAFNCSIAYVVMCYAMLCCAVLHLDGRAMGCLRMVTPSTCV